MSIVTAKWINPEQTIANIEYSNGIKSSVPVNNFVRTGMQAWLDAGNAIVAYMTATEEQLQLLPELYRIVAEKQSALSDPLDDLTLTVITGLQGDRARGKPLTPQQQAILDAGDTDPRRQVVEDLLVAAKSIRADIDAGTITTLDEVRTDSRWP
jgi:hypothetical protein